MTNHSETTGSSENGDITGRGGREHPACESHTVFEGDVGYGASPADHQVTLRTPAELADALPYLLGYRPEDSIVLVALHDRGGRGRFGGRARLGIPANPDDWGAVAQQLTQGLVKGSERRGTRPASMVAYLCQEPGKGETGRQVMERLQPLAHRLRLECGRLDVPVIEALCIADGRFWSYCCGGKGCCPVEGVAMGLPGTSVLAAAATYAGIQVRGTLRELRARLLPLETGAALEQEIALDTAGMALVPRILDEASRAAVADETLDLAGRVVRRLAEAPVVPGALPADRRDDELLGFDEAAALILGLQDRVTRDRAAGWMEGDEAAPALRLWRALARRCVGPYGEHAAAPLTLAGWVAWSTGDELEARRPSPWPWARTRTICSPAFCTRPATRASIPSRYDAACAPSARDAGCPRQRRRPARRLWPRAPGAPKAHRARAGRSSPQAWAEQRGERRPPTSGVRTRTIIPAREAAPSSGAAPAKKTAPASRTTQTAPAEPSTRTDPAQ